MSGDAGHQSSSRSSGGAGTSLSLSPGLQTSPIADCLIRQLAVLAFEDHPRTRSSEDPHRQIRCVRHHHVSREGDGLPIM